ncbi:sporulation/spore germination protein [Desulfitobacterium dichloroeliminans LMG P-21439]|uniref:Sporulation/spore germination protein n=1 Tax=Desulfitobacterium dichloroeliminans (strain LMG P-21439 / DCA1) TaxID=871963 RepID=L0FAT7_DESDL|nr:GerMN domain-containing protein [Desulfitobacterium dichloroeliminans]AGA70342.1 sporulation/spore germination protein [Desulfitobacterium dichloroeliminans LMG P-21439]
MNKLKFRSFILAVSFLFFVFTTVGCGSDDISKNTPPTNTSSPNGAEPQPPEPTATVDKTMDVTLYFPTPDASGLVATKRTLNVTEETSAAAIKEIFKEFTNPSTGSVAPLPEKTELLDVKIKDGVATLNLSKSFRENFKGGTTGEEMVLFSIVNTLTKLPDVQSVEFLLEGELKAAILGGLDTSIPVEPDESLILK